jgi:hypothetical protein
MIAEAPNAPLLYAERDGCAEAADAEGAESGQACAKARVVGVAFWDSAHGQTGVAPNAIELHPILGFACLSKPGPPPPPPPPPASCSASYPDQCIAPPPPDLDCSDIPYRNFRVLWNVPDPDPHHFDGNRDGVGCES